MGNGTEYADFASSPLATSLKLAFWSACICVGGPLNVFLLVRYARELCGPNARSRVLWLKLQLNISDTLILFGYALSQVIWELTYYWYAGNGMCKVVKFLHAFPFTLCAASLAAIGLDRMLCTIRPFTHSDIARLRTKILIGVAWVYASVFSAPQLFLFTAAEVPPSLLGLGANETGHWQCNSVVMFDRYVFRRPTSAFVKALFHLNNATHLITIFWLPLIVIGICYGFMVAYLCRHYAAMEKIGLSATRGSRARQGMSKTSRTISTAAPRDSETEFDKSRSPRSSKDLIPLLSDKKASTISLRVPPDHALLLGSVCVQEVEEFAGHSIVPPPSTSGLAKHSRPAKERPLPTRMVTTTLILMTVFACCWLPYHVRALLPHIVHLNPAALPLWAQIIDLVGKLLIVLNSVANPFIYGPFGAHHFFRNFLLRRRLPSAQTRAKPKTSVY